MKITVLLVIALVAPLTTWGQSEDDFFTQEVTDVNEAKTWESDPTKPFNETADGLRWGGSVTSFATWNGGWVGQWPGLNLASGWKDGLDLGLSTKLFLDGRPDRDFRFRLSLKTGYPFTTDTKVVTATLPSTNTTTLQTPNIKVWEMFTDVTLADTVFLRFGKQVASWGASYFYSPGDVISLTAKDASDPTAEREGPVALKASIPFPGLRANLTGFVLARDTYFAGELPTLRSLGYAVQADALLGDAQVSVGGFYQRDNAPKVVATLNTGFGFLNIPVITEVNLFSEAVISYGADVLKGEGTKTLGSFGSGFAQVSSWGKSVYYTGTVGASYSNTDGNWGIRGEYLYNPFGSSDKDAARRSFNTFLASTTGYYTSVGGTNATGRNYSYGDAATPGIHNVSSLFSLSKLGGNDKLGLSALWQQNLSDGSGWVKPSISFQASDQLAFQAGVSMVYGDDDTQFPVTFQYRDKDGTSLGVKRVTLNLGVTFGSGKY